MQQSQHHRRRLAIALSIVALLGVSCDGGAGGGDDGNAEGTDLGTDQSTTTVLETTTTTVPRRR